MCAYVCVCVWMCVYVCVCVCVCVCVFVDVRVCGCDVRARATWAWGCACALCHARKHPCCVARVNRVLTCSHTPARGPANTGNRYTATIKGNAQVDYVVFCEVSAQPKDWLVESQWVQRLADEQEEVLAQGGRLPAGTPKIGAILAKPPPGFGVQPVASLKAELDSLGKLRLMRGVRAYLDVNSTSTAALLAGFAELGRRKWVVDFFVPEITDSRVAGLLAQSPDTTFVVEHLGCGCDIEGIYTNATAFAAWKAAVFEMAAQKNVGCFMLGGTMASWANKEAVNASMIKPFIATAIQAFQYDRLCFEANWFFSNWKTMDGFGVWVGVLHELLAEMGTTHEQMVKLFRTNALRVYGIAA